MKKDYDEDYPSESIKVILGGIGSGLLGFTLGSLIAVRHNRPIAGSAITMGLKLAGFGTLFLASRQFLLTPLLSPPPSSVGHRRSPGHLDGLLATSLAAALVGGGLNGCLRGRSVILRSGLTTGLLGGSVQVVVNELLLLSRAYRRSSEPSTTTTISQPDQPPQQAWWERWIPLTRIEDEQWKLRLIDRLSDLDLHQATIDHQISQLLLAIDRHSSKPPPPPPPPSSSSSST